MADDGPVNLDGIRLHKFLTRGVQGGTTKEDYVDLRDRLDLQAEEDR